MLENLSEPAEGQIPTNLRLLYLMEIISSQGSPMTASDLVTVLGLPKPTVHRLLSTAEDEGFLQRDIDGRAFGPGARLRKLSANTLSSQRLRTERLVILRWLAEEVGETCNLAAPGRFGMVYLDRVETHWPLRIKLPIGTKVPFHCTASGKMYLSSLRSSRLERMLSTWDLDPYTDHSITDLSELVTHVASIRKNGYSTDNQEFMDGMVAIAVPIYDDQGRLLTTLSLHVPVQRMSLETLKTHVPVLKQAAERLEQLLD